MLRVPFSESRPTGSTVQRPNSFAATALGALLLLIPCLGSSAALADTYYVGTGGSDANPGTSPDQPFATILKANQIARPGDVIQVLDGKYAHFPNPSVSGIPDARITYVGNIGQPDLVQITDAAIALARDHVTIKGMALQRGFNLTGRRDSIAWCEVGGTRPQINGADDCVVAFCNVVAPRFWFFGSESDTLPVAERDTITDCRFTLRPTGTSAHTVRIKAVADGVIQRCQFDIDVADGAVGASVTKLFWVRRTKFVDTSWDITNHCVSGCDEAGWFVLRDFVQENRFERDTVIMRGPGDVQFFAAASGTYPGTVMNNNFEGCVFKVVGPNSYRFGFFYQDAAQWDTLQNCVFVSQRSALGVNDALRGPMLIDHCTFASFDPYLGSASLLGGTITGTVALRSNVFFTAASASPVRESTPLYADAVSYRGHMVGNYNVFHSSLGANLSINGLSAGTSAPGVGKPWNNATGADSVSIFGDPLFENASSALAFDGHVRAGSAAIGAGHLGSDAGAYPFGPDVTPPAAVLGLAATEVGDRSLVLTWAAPGDDGGRGIATAYDLRWSEQPITEDNFGDASSLPAPSPLGPGGTQSYTVEGLTPGGVYYYALRTRDEANNWSALSNVLSLTLPLADLVAPRAITDLDTK